VEQGDFKRQVDFQLLISLGQFADFKPKRENSALGIWKIQLDVEQNIIKQNFCRPLCLK